MTTDEAITQLAAELEAWPGWHLTELHAGSMWSSHQPGTDVWAGPGSSWITYMTDSWCATVIQEGCWPSPSEANAPRVFAWGRSMAEAVTKLTANLVERRAYPHTWDHIYEHRYQRDCEDCLADHGRLEPHECPGIPGCRIFDTVYS